MLKCPIGVSIVCVNNQHDDNDDGIWWRWYDDDNDGDDDDDDEGHDDSAEWECKPVICGIESSTSRSEWGALKLHLLISIRIWNLN